MTSQTLQAIGNKEAKRHLRSTLIHRVTVCLFLLLSMGTLVDSLETAIADFRITLYFLGGSYFQCQPYDSEVIRSASEECLQLLVGACGIDSQLVSVASSDCDGSSAILRDVNMVTTGASPPAPDVVSQCVQDIFRLGVCLGFFERTYPYVDSISLGLDVPMPTNGPSVSPSKSPMPSALSSLSSSLSPTVAPAGAPILTVPEEPNVSDGSSGGDKISTDESGLGRDPIYNPVPGSSGGNNIAVVAGSVVGVALLAGLLAMFAYKRENKQKAWRKGVMRDVTLDDVDEEDIEAHHHVVANYRTKEGLLFPPPESSDTGSSLFGRMLASTATVALGALQFRSQNSEECTQENSAEELGSSQDDGSTENAVAPRGDDLEDAQADNDKIVPVSILRKPKERLAAESPFKENASFPTVAPDIASAPNATNSEGVGSDADSRDAVSAVVSKAKSPTQPFAMGLLTCAMHPFHCIAPIRGVLSQDQLSEGSSIPYQTDFGPDESWDPDDNSIGSAEGQDNFQTTKPASPSERLLENITKKSFEMQRLRTPAETEPYRPKNYL